MKIGLDIMGGDFAPNSPIKGVIQASEEISSGASFVLIGDESLINESLKKEGLTDHNFTIVHAPDVIGMHEHPAKTFSKKPNSSISVGFHLLKEGKIDAFASTGNTGAMLVGSMFTVRAISGIIRPCITSVMPKSSGGVNIILDVGTNADCKPDVLYQFGILGSIFAEQVYGIKNPKVALLNIGEEEEKGNMLTQSTHQLMKNTTDFNFVGNVEGRDIFSDKVDVIVCDGYTGNVVLKEAEAFYSEIKKRNISDEYFDRFNYEIYGGTPVLGVNSNVIVGHGSSSPLAIKNMLILAKDVAEANLSDKIKKAFN